MSIKYSYLKKNIMLTEKKSFKYFIRYNYNDEMKPLFIELSI